MQKEVPQGFVYSALELAVFIGDWLKAMFNSKLFCQIAYVLV